MDQFKIKELAAGQPKKTGQLTAKTEVFISLRQAGALTFNIRSLQVSPIGMSIKMTRRAPEVRSDKSLTLLTNGPMGQWFNGPMVQWTNGPINQWSNGPMVQWTNGPMD